jgi:hypothetical protein
MDKERHHYIPRFYLKNFACDEEKNFYMFMNIKVKFSKAV